MELDYSVEGKVKIGMIEYVENMLKNFLRDQLHRYCDHAIE
jgi:hypothetical protein